MNTIFIVLPILTILMFDLGLVLKPADFKLIAGRLAKVEPFDVMMSIASMTVFTFLSLPLYQALLSRTDEQVSAFIAHRKQEITRLVLKGLRP